ncbi:MAG: 4-hydroxythreonine-4-phosphate dehydrogenase PdxA [Ignavibacteria bacterium]|nr:4-hydroxythreonine-4-phosphate dehydrogenase PdxA [Ignavibacteria bacterium]
MKSSKPRLILTTGDPDGIGPEIILKIFKNKKFTELYNLKISGSKKIFDYYSSLLNLPEIEENAFIEIPLPRNFKINPGKTGKSAGKFSGDSVKKAAELCLKNEFDAVVTLPLSKESLNKGGYNYPGHTEMLSEITSSSETAMILHSRKFSVALLTGHIPVKNISRKLTKDLIFRKIVTVNNSLIRDFGIKNPKIAILSLNPHSGDGGLIGNEEINIINPVILKMNSMGFNIRGAFSSDAYFANKMYQKFDITAAVYHDQGLIPFKMISFGKGVNFTAGLKITRTSPDHGTAFDIAGTGNANEESTMHAIKLAEKIANGKERKFQE